MDTGSLAPGQAATINFTVSDPTVGTIQPNPLTVVGPDTNYNLRFNPLKTGDATITINPVPGFASDPAVQTLRIRIVN